VNSIRRIDSLGGLPPAKSKILCGVLLLSSRTRRAVLHNAVAFGLLGGTGLLIPVARANALRVGQPAPPATLVTLDGKRLSTSDFFGKVVILTFLATWVANPHFGLALHPHALRFGAA